MKIYTKMKQTLFLCTNNKSVTSIREFHAIETRTDLVLVLLLIALPYKQQNRYVIVSVIIKYGSIILTTKFNIIIFF